VDLLKQAQEPTHYTFAIIIKMMHNKGLTKGCKKVTKIVTTAF
jgi:hypothetical protein